MDVECRADYITPYITVDQMKRPNILQGQDPKWIVVELKIWDIIFPITILIGDEFDSPLEDFGGVNVHSSLE